MLNAFCIRVLTIFLNLCLIMITTPSGQLWTSRSFFCNFLMINYQSTTLLITKLTSFSKSTTILRFPKMNEFIKLWSFKLFCSNALKMSCRLYVGQIRSKVLSFNMMLDDRLIGWWYLDTSYSYALALV